ncbi:hypothetical protein ISS03_00185 [Patescibacteria group bacterium]|nr:hypothetical protein [Patescibacteria group bacterium]
MFLLTIQWGVVMKADDHIENILEQAALIRGRGLNCWEAMDCGRGVRKPVGHDGRFCPVPVVHCPEGIITEKHAGKCCWMVRDAACRGRRSHEIGWVKSLDCESCFFFISCFTFLRKTK